MEENSIEDYRKLLSTKQGRIDSLLELTKAVNSNFSKSALLKLLEFTLIDRFKLSKYALFIREENWELSINEGNISVAEKINVEEDLLKFGVVQDVRKYPTELFQDFDFLIPISNKKINLAYLVVGEMKIGKLESLDENLKFLETICSFIIVSLENKRLFKSRLEQERISKELELAGQVQNMLIPSSLPNNEHMNIAAYYKPHGGIGGDYYDFITLDESNVVFCMCDVSGKGISAGMLMANFQAQLRSLVNKYTSLEQLVDHLNYKLFEVTNGERYITMFLGLYNFTNKKLRYVNAGHNPTLLHQQDEIVALDSGCTILGAFDNLPRIQPGEVILDENALIFCYTDGITELENDLGEQYGLERLNSFLFKNASLEVNEIVEKVQEEMETFKGDRDYNDDVSILINRFF